MESHIRYQTFPQNIPNLLFILNGTAIITFPVKLVNLHQQKFKILYIYYLFVKHTCNLISCINDIDVSSDPKLDSHNALTKTCKQPFQKIFRATIVAIQIVYVNSTFSLAKIF